MCLAKQSGMYAASCERQHTLDPTCSPMLSAQAGKLELVSSVEVPRAARKIRATFCPKVHITEPEYIVMGGEDTSVYIYDISKPSYGPLVITRLQVRLYCQSLWQNCWSDSPFD